MFEIAFLVEVAICRFGSVVGREVCSLGKGLADARREIPEDHFLYEVFERDVLCKIPYLCQVLGWAKSLTWDAS